MDECSSLNNYDEYAAHHQSSQSIIEQDEKCTRAIIHYISQRGNPFATLSSQLIPNILTNAELDVESNAFLLHC